MDLNEKELDKLGDALEELTKSVMQKKWKMLWIRLKF